ncbi:MAG: bifunctional phosphopantothenoylcysteine decarboxylase/phosphopantothenate--cysteine ligase CoaBC [Proteobacteria bacterium]|nr:bifunctional phosphopantothenoylcysteine decarboxylase/phosphopantothenate--cysteine ligase CoaBC [Pseudomonadota bacterium]
MKEWLEGKTIVLCVCGGIAAYKSVEVLRLLQKQGATVRVIMTQGVQEFVGPLTFQALSGQPVFTSLFEKNDSSTMRHIDWAREADAVIVAPATANIIGKLANGIADDAMSTFMMAVRSPVLLCPSMNTHMYENRAVQRNIDILEADGCYIVEPGTGELACGDRGAGRFPDPWIIVDRLLAFLTPKDFTGKKILVTAGPTQEPIDPVRFISNPSSGKMGFSVARMAEYRGADVTLISGPVSLPDPLNVACLRTRTTLEMEKAVFDHVKDVDVVIKSAAVSDYRVEKPSAHKIKKDKDNMILTLVKNTDILKELGKIKKKQILVGFAAETEDLVKNAEKKIREKNLDMIVANIVGQKTSGFGIDTNIVRFLYQDGTNEELPSMLKEEVAMMLLDRIKHLMAR